MSKCSVKKLEIIEKSECAESRKRRRSSSSSDSEVNIIGFHHRKKWKGGPQNLEADLLEELGLTMLESDEDKSADEIIDSSEGENENKSSCRKNANTLSKREPLKFSTQYNVPLSESGSKEVIDKCVAVEEDSDGGVFDCEESQDNSQRLEKLKPVNCSIRNSQIIYQNEKTVVDRVKTNAKCEDVKRGWDESKHREKDVEEIDDEEFFVRRVVKRKECVQGTDYFADLSDEIVVDIFQWLPKKTLVRCALVSKRFRQLAYDESLWVRCDLSNRKLPPCSLNQVISKGCRILRLAQTALIKPVCDESSVSCKLQFLDLSMAVLTESCLASLLNLCRHLKKLSLENCTLNQDCARALANNRQLEVVNMSMCGGVASSFLETFLTNCKKLQSVNLAWTNLSVSDLDKLVAHLPERVERLNLSGCRTSLSNEHVIQIFESCDRLLELDVSDCNRLTKSILDYIATKVHAIEYLALSRCYAFDATSLLSLRLSRSLVFLDIFGLMQEEELVEFKEAMQDISINQFPFSSVARPTVGLRRTSIWGLRVRD